MYRYPDSAWVAQIRRMRRSDPIYKPAMLLVVLDLIDEGLASPDFVPAELAMQRFDELLLRAGLAAGRTLGRAFMPAFHLSMSSRTDEPFWQLVHGGVPLEQCNEPSSNRVLLSQADGFRLDEVLADIISNSLSITFLQVADNEL